MSTSLFTEEHEALRAVVRRWVEREGAEGAPAWERTGGWPRDVLRTVASQGWLSTALAASGGGDVLAGVAMWEELGRLRSAGVVQDLLAQAHAAALLSEAGVPAVAQRAHAGELLVTLAGGALRLRPDGDALLLSGTAPALANAAVADTAVAVVPDEQGIALAVVDTRLPGWHATPPASPFGRRGGHAADVEFRDVRLAGGDVVARGAEGLALMRRRQDRWRLDHAAATVAAAWLAWEDAKAYALQREAFGRPIATFQVNRHALADMAAELSALRALVHDTARRLTLAALESGDTAALRLRADRVSAAVADRCLQLHGGYGYTMEFDVQRAWRDAAHLRVDEAGDAALRDEIAAGLESRMGGGSS
ncbi:MAG TPA: acyl-CoA dehydrogenase family protein [Egibacteraceae bacterium]|nr:acyl-CoA dehydrogenase family protein [Egibacteraceae bacterium]